jgi:uncharacterized protein
VPELRVRVTDLAGLLPPARRSALEASLERFERETTHQLAVLTVSSLEGEPIEQFSLRVVEAWKLGRGDFDNGMLVLVAAGDRQARIEVGYGLEGVVPDTVASRVLREQMIPRFRKGRMGEGIEAGVQALMQAARGERLAALPEPERGPATDPLAVAFFMGLVGGFAASVIARRRVAVRTGLGAALAGVGGWLLISLGIGLLAALIGGALGLSGFGGAARRRWRGAPWGGGGGWGRPGGFGGVGRSGGFGGLGGGFGGGGATGRW